MNALTCDPTKRFFTFVALILLACLNPGLVSGQTADQEPFEWITTLVDSTMKAENIPALSIGVVMDGQLAFVKGFGNKVRGGEEVDGSTIYQIGSDTKKMTGIIAKSLVLEGTLDFDEPIVTYLGTSITDKTREKMQGITIRHLLQHQSGVPYRALTNRRFDGNPMLIPYTEEDLLNDLNAMELSGTPGTEFAYSNFGYAIAGYVCERASGKSYSELVEIYLANKLGLENTMIEPRKDQIDQIATPYRKDNRTMESKRWTMGKMAAGGGVYSNIYDLAKLMKAQINAYREADEIIDAGSPFVLTDQGKAGEGSYGLGLGKSVNEYGTRYGHGGDLDGFASAYLFAPDRNGGVVFLTSSGGRWVGQLEKQLFSRLFEENP